MSELNHFHVSSYDQIVANLLKYVEKLWWGPGAAFYDNFVLWLDLHLWRCVCKMDMIFA